MEPSQGNSPRHASSVVFDCNKFKLKGEKRHQQLDSTPLVTHDQFVLFDVLMSQSATRKINSKKVTIEK